IVLLLIVMFIPVIQLFVLFTLPVPFIMYTAKYGFKPSIIVFVITLIFSMLFATIVSLPATIFAGIGGIVVGNGIFRDKNAYEIWAQGTVGFIVGFVLLLTVLQFVFSINLFEEMDMAIQETMDMTRSIFSQLQVGSEVEEPLNIMEEQLKQF